MLQTAIALNYQPLAARLKQCQDPPRRAEQQFRSKRLMIFPFSILSQFSDQVMQSVGRMCERYIFVMLRKRL